MKPGAGAAPAYVNGGWVAEGSADRVPFTADRLTIQSR
jgi:hypothetical protein